MQEIKQIYHNHLGTAFYWRKDNGLVLDKIQLVFREMGFYFTSHELQLFKRCIEDSYNQNKCCGDCELKNKCQKFLLKTPCSQIDLAVSMKELDAVKDLVEGTLFKINVDNYLYREGMN